MTPTKDSVEKRSQQLLDDCRDELGKAIDYFGGKLPTSRAQLYVFYFTVHVQRAVEGYLILRRGDLIEASKHMIRTCIEATFRIFAVLRQPDTLFRIAYMEYRSIVAAINVHNQPTKVEDLKKLTSDWNEYASEYFSEYPEQRAIAVEEKLTIEQLAIRAEMSSEYNGQYRAFSQVVHGTFGQAAGGMKGMDYLDGITMVQMAIRCIHALQILSAPASNLNALNERRISLEKEIESL
jgi:hypothetical protein